MYHQDKYAFTSNALRSTIFKILRQGVRKLYEYVYNEGADHLPPVKKINSNEIRHIIHNSGSLKVRFLLLDVYCSRRYDKELVVHTLEEIDYYLMQY